MLALLGHAKATNFELGRPQRPTIDVHKDSQLLFQCLP
jgi:hypothetical protein